MGVPIRTSKTGRPPVYPGRLPYRKKKREMTELTANIAAGDLREHLTLRQPIEVRGPSGTATITYQDVDTDVWGQAVPMPMPMLYYAQEFAPKSDATVTIRYRSDVRPGWMLATDDGIFQYIVRGVPIDVRRRRSLLLLHCETLQVTSV